MLRKYLFNKNTNFKLHQYYYSDPECHFPIYSVISEGTYHLAMNSWVVAGGTIAFYELMRMQVIPYTQDVASRMKRLLQNNCPEVTSFNTSSNWQPYQKYQIVHKTNYYDDDDGYDHMSYDEDCSEIFNVTLSELQLLRMEVRHHNLHPIHGTSTSKELLLGDIDTSLPTRHHHKPSSYQTPLKYEKVRIIFISLVLFADKLMTIIEYNILLISILNLTYVYSF